MREMSLALCLTLLLSGCSPRVYQSGNMVQEARLIEDRFITKDGSVLPVKKWLPENNIQAIIIALHGFNDYSKFFQMPAEFLSLHGIASYSYDQRGFGQSPARGYWHGVDTLTSDLITFINLIKRKHRGIPIYILGHSMGGAVVIATMTRKDAPSVDGLILAAPAVWGRATMPWYQTVLLEVLSHTMPWLTLTGKGFEIIPSDNIEMLRAQGRDPLVIKATRVDAIYGLANLMDIALQNARFLEKYRTLFLYGEKDQVIPENAVNKFLQDLNKNSMGDRTLVFFPDGYHMLLRDLHAETAWHQIWTWIKRNSGSVHTEVSAGMDNSGSLKHN
jgi:alpha-beta hydrolase superfamily lysophospholipase